MKVLTVDQRNARRAERVKQSGGTMTSMALSADTLRHIGRLKEHYQVRSRKQAIECALKDRYKQVTGLFGD